ncbi:O-antigen ligase family protein [Paenibacillus sp. FSL R5-0887]|uniref:O-antigen ligase family protein n=1 Tax=Paenibacillus sp. FSL R5-0887 TaxID=2921662 RepID=UPI0030F825EE
MQTKELNRTQQLLMVIILAYLIMKPYPGFMGENFLRIMDFSSIILIGAILFLIYMTRFEVKISLSAGRTLLIIAAIFLWQLISMGYNALFGGVVVLEDLVDMYKPLIMFSAFFLGSLLSVSPLFFEKAIKFFVIFQFFLCIIQMRFGGFSLGLFSGRDMTTIANEFSNRAIGTFGNPNFLAVFMASCAVWYFYKLLFVNKRNIFMFLISFGTVLITQSRTATIIGLSTCLLVLVANILLARKHKIRSFVILIMSILVVYTAYHYVLINGQHNSGQFGYLVSGISKVLSGDLVYQSSFQGRTLYWANIGVYIKSHPLIGSGPMKGELGAPNVADNNYVFIVYKYGFIGLALWLFLTFTILKKTFKTIKYQANKVAPVFVLLFWVVLLSSALLIDIMEHIRYAPITFFLTSLALNVKNEDDYEFKRTDS